VVLYFVGVLGLVQQLFVGFVIFQNVLETSRDFSEDLSVDFSFRIIDLLFLIALDLVLLDDLLVRRLQRNVVASDLLVQPFEGVDKLLSQSKVGSLKLLDAFFVF